MDEIRAAAERLTGDWDKSYPPAPHTATVDAVLLDTARVAKAYLAEHPADDGEPLTRDWAKTCGWSHVAGASGVGAALYHDEANLYAHTPPAKSGLPWCVELWPEDALSNGKGPYRAVTVRTRGDLRRLCAALGIDLD